VQRVAASQAIVVPSLWPIASPFIPNINAVAKPLNHWIPLGKLGAPTNPPDIDFPQWGQGSIAATEKAGGI